MIVRRIDLDFGRDDGDDFGSFNVVADRRHRGLRYGVVDDGFGPIDRQLFDRQDNRLTTKIPTGTINRY